jgi:hypothetical protein
MAVQLSIPYETLIALVEQLPPEQQQDLVLHLLERTQQHPLSTAERRMAFESMTMNLGQVSTVYSDRRQDWYEDDGR